MECIQSTFNVSGDVHNKAKLYNEEKGAVSGAKIIKLLVAFAGRVENCSKDIWTLVSNIPE